MVPHIFKLFGVIFIITFTMYLSPEELYDIRSMTTNANEFIKGIITVFFGIVFGVLSIALVIDNQLVVGILILASVCIVFAGVVYAITSIRKRLFKK